MPKDKVSVSSIWNTYLWLLLKVIDQIVSNEKNAGARSIILLITSYVTDFANKQISDAK